MNLGDVAKKVWAGRRLIGPALAAILGTIFIDAATHPKVEPPEPRLEIAGLVGLGDSYSSGEGLAPFLDATPCHRSPKAYGPLLSGSAADDDLTFAACAGAVIGDLAGQVPPSSDDVDLVTLTISGNDARFTDVLEFCALEDDCLDSPEWDRDGFETLEAWADDRIATIESELPGPFGDLDQRFTDARVLVLGYPRLFDAEVSIAGQPQCRVHRAAFSPEERAAIAQLGDRLNLAVARQALAAGLEYVEAADAFTGHETCAPDGPWIDFLDNRFFELLRNTRGLSPRNFHPTADGQAMYARLLDCYLDAHDADPHAGRTVPGHARSLGGLVEDVAIGLAGDAVHECAVGS